MDDDKYDKLLLLSWFFQTKRFARQMIEYFFEHGEVEVDGVFKKCLQIFMKSKRKRVKSNILMVLQMSKLSWWKSLEIPVEQAITEINFIGESKKAMREERTSGIHSTTQVQHALSVLDLYQLKPNHYREYIEHMK